MTTRRDSWATQDHTHGLPPHEARGLWSAQRYMRKHGVRPNSIDLANLLKAEDRLAARPSGFVVRMWEVYGEFGEYDRAARRMAQFR